MIRTVAEGIKIYKEALRAYKRETTKYKKKYGNLDIMFSDRGIYERFLDLNRRLNAMAKVLGLTKAEERRFMAEFDIKDS